MNSRFVIVVVCFLFSMDDGCICACQRRTLGVFLSHLPPCCLETKCLKLGWSQERGTCLCPEVLLQKAHSHVPVLMLGLPSPQVSVAQEVLFPAEQLLSPIWISPLSLLLFCSCMVSYCAKHLYRAASEPLSRRGSRLHWASETSLPMPWDLS